MKVLIPLILYAALSWLLGLMVCAVMVRAKRSGNAIAVVAGVLFGGPVGLYYYIYIKEGVEQRQFQEDIAYVKELCAKQGGDKIYRTVDNVEGVFQMRARNPDMHSDIKDQFGMFDPWSASIGDSRHVGLRLYVTPEYGGYLFFEQQPEYQKEGPPYRRTVVTWTGKAAATVSDPRYAGWMRYGQRQITVATVRSRYGYITEDISTPEMRERWVAGGRIKVIDLHTKEILAERVGFYRSTNVDMQKADKVWTGNGGGHSCPEPHGLNRFLESVLKPINSQPSQMQLQQLSEER